MSFGKQNEKIEQMRKWIIKQNEFATVTGQVQRAQQKSRADTSLTND